MLPFPHNNFKYKLFVSLQKAGILQGAQMRLIVEKDIARREMAFFRRRDAKIA